MATQIDEMDDNAVKEKRAPEIEPVKFFQLFRFITPWEIFLLFIGLILAVIKAFAMPAVVIIYSEFTAMLVDRTYGIGTSSKTYLLPLFNGGRQLTNATREENYEELYYDSMSYGALLTIASVILFICGIFTVDLFNLVALKQVTRMRIEFFKATIRQDIGWHDVTNDQNFGLRITDEIEKIRDGIAEKVSHFINLIAGFVITVIISFIYGWKLTLAVSVYIPIVMVTNYYVGMIQSKLTTRELESYASAGSLVEEVLAAIRTIAAFGGEKTEAERYDKFLVPARKAAVRKGAFTGFSDGVLKSLLFISCSGAFWYGVNLILADRDKEEKEYTPAILMIAFFGIVVGADNVARCAPFLEAFAIARGAASTIFKTINSTTKIDPLSKDGHILKDGLKGNVEFQDVFFTYPSRQDVTILRGLNIKIESGKTVALVGHSGCGKSTCIQLLQRFYDPIFGQILLDDFDIRKYNIKWLRTNIAIVGQEPVLFQGTIGENIRFGKPEATQKEIEEASKAAGSHDFITEFPDCYNTFIGEKGAQLSGGQKQRIAIARALVQNPKILLLDEATSALDYQSEKLVQEALDRASKGRTTIVVSHRLSAIKSADKIIYIDHGKVLEEGTHEELMKLNGRYYQMVTASELKSDEDIEVVTRKKSLAMYEKSFELDVHNLKSELGEKNATTSRLNSITSETLKMANTNATKDKTLLENSDQQIKYWQSFVRILKMSKPEWDTLICGVFFSSIFGLTYPAFAVVFGEFYAALAESEENNVLERTRILSLVCLGIGAATGLICFFQMYIFNSSGAWLTTRIRSITFRSILKQEISWFDEEQNSVGALSARLAGDAANIQGAVGYPLSGIIQSLSNFIFSTSVGFYYSWKLALLCLSMVPFIVGSVVLEAKFIAKTMMEEKEILEDASRIATEAITYIRTVAGLRREQAIIDQYTVSVLKVEALLQKKLRYRGLVNSCGQSLMFFGYAIALCYGGVLVSWGLVPFQDIIKVSETLLYGAMMLAQSLAFTPAFSAALLAGHRLFQIIDREPRIKSPPPADKNKTVMNQFMGVKYQDIEFRYPTRPNIPVLQGLDLDILHGKTVALVGHSGCGKSTCIQLLQRFYDPDKGRIFIEQGNIKSDLSIENLRSKLGIVSQEPVLFERTIAENIAYGDNTREVTMIEIIDAAKQANAHNFILSLPNGYETRLGSRGTQLSGGQKQRIAIARALVRNPKILLLDEATSALDLQSEKLVQSALDAACSGRTSIVIAHRLSTVQNADVICVFEDGKIVEMGNHQKLMSKAGIYYQLYKTQPALN
ncbi:multidrug resistance protein homolog 65 [Condylostylus longicornis]|uniref:multidrug resistance protein homolog 65 n=1 Tax=Condylostylus longicornis TaxID=2530218 RepID=UPI00244E520F|nr:multidrug resistance protein homolog 65 [Condylostylus longicornis]